MSHRIFMTGHKLGIALFTLLVFLSASLQAQDLPRTRPDRLGFDRDRLQQMDAVLQSYVDNEQIAGSVTMVLRNGRVAYSSAKGMQDREAGIAMREDSMMRIASFTKATIATGIMILHERGSLNIADPLSKYLPEWADVKVGVVNNNGGYTLEALSRPINLRDMLTHTSGIGYGGFGGTGPVQTAWVNAGFPGFYLSSRPDGIRETVRKMATLPMQAQPGVQWIYGYNIDILGAVIEVVSGKSLSQFMSEELFTPLGMDDTHFFIPPEKAGRLSKVYRGRPGGGIETAPAEGTAGGQGEFVSGPRATYSGGAGLVSTAENYARFLQMTLNGGELNGVRVLGPKTVELMTSDHLHGIPFQNGTGMGLGFSVLKDLGARGTMGSLGEYGWGSAYHGTYWVDKDANMVVVYLTQIVNPNPGLDDFQKLRARLYSSIVE